MSHVFVTGFMGAGKSAVGQVVAASLGRPFVDLDREIERREGLSVPEIFRDRGEEGFREAEHAALEALVEAGPAVIATGGGAVLRHDNQALLKRHGIVAYLSVSPEEAMARLGDGEDRPLLAGGGIDTARRILTSRLPVYAATADIVIPTDGRSVEQVAEAVLSALRQRPAPSEARIEVSEAGGGYTIVLGAGLLDSAAPLIAEVSQGSLAVVSDDTVWPLAGQQLASELAGLGRTVTRHLVAAGESSKSWSQAGALLEGFAEAGLDRTSTIVAVGGGVVGDLAGFCAATYMRGIGLVHVPTTLLAQVDSSIGGKTGVDLPAGKNLVGAFWPPRLVIADTSVLATLPASEWTNGLVELVKGAFLEGAEALEAVEGELAALVTRDPETVRRAVERAAAFKARIVSADLREADLRECLNFGHTLGHALEMLVGYGVLPHGLAVAEGMRFAAQLAQRTAGARASLYERIVAALETVGAGQAECHHIIRQALERVAPAQLLEAMKADKKSRSGAVRFVLLTAPGEWEAVSMEDGTLLEELQAWLRSVIGGGE